MYIRVWRQRNVCLCVFKICLLHCKLIWVRKSKFDSLILWHAIYDSIDKRWFIFHLTRLATFLVRIYTIRQTQRPKCKTWIAKNRLFKELSMRKDERKPNGFMSWSIGQCKYKWRGTPINHALLCFCCSNKLYYFISL